MLEIYCFSGTDKKADPEGAQNSKDKPAVVAPKATAETTEESSEEEEEEEDDGQKRPFRPRPSTIIGFRTIQPVGSGECS